jgi:hypothetical protein
MRFRLPDPLRSERDWNRFQHLDIPGMTAEQRWAEHEDVKEAYARLIRSGHAVWIPKPDGFPMSAADWLRERIAATALGGDA